MVVLPSAVETRTSSQRTYWLLIAGCYSSLSSNLLSEVSFIITSSLSPSPAVVRVSSIVRHVLYVTMSIILSHVL